jgi:hypothetical protein
MQTLNQSSIKSVERRIADVVEKLPYQLRQVRVRQIPNLIDRQINGAIHCLDGKSACRRAAIKARNP